MKVNVKKRIQVPSINYAMLLKLSCLSFPLLCLGSIFDLNQTFEKLREGVMKAEYVAAVGGRQWLSVGEELVNEILMKAKRAEMAEGMKNPEKYPPALHFFKGKQYINQSEVFRFIRKMPKGALLHGHNKAMVSSYWIISNLTYNEHLYTCRDHKRRFIFTFDTNPQICLTEVRNVHKERKKAKDKHKFDRELEKHINMNNTKPWANLANKSRNWAQFEDIFAALDYLYKNETTFVALHKRLLEELREDNIMYAEVRASLSPITGNNGKPLSSVEVSLLLQGIVAEFRLKHPDFMGLKVIYAKRNKATIEEMTQSLAQFTLVHLASSYFVIGFDLVGSEDTGDPINKFAMQFLLFPPTANFFFHAGETNWNGRSDWNILDAILLRTKRIGHGFALPKHTELRAAIKKYDIAIEVNPISNQVLGFVWDMRNHPASLLIAENFPIVISSDDPGFWGAKGLSHDFYYAFMAMASADADLRFLKQLALNSIKYSTLSVVERPVVNLLFKAKWQMFIDHILDPANHFTKN